MILRVLSDDPATVNYGRTLLTVEKIDQKLKFKIKRAWLVKKTISSDLIKTDISTVLNKYSRSMETCLVKNGPINLYCAERFMPRSGGGMVQHGEAIAMMLALNVHVLQGTESKLIPAVSWKTQIKRYFSLEFLYKEIKPCPDHILDATFIGLYAAYTHFGIKPYSTLTCKDIAYIMKRLKPIGIKIKARADELKREAKAAAKLLPPVPKKAKKKKRKKKEKGSEKPV